MLVGIQNEGKFLLSNYRADEECSRLPTEGEGLEEEEDESEMGGVESDGEATKNHTHSSSSENDNEDVDDTRKPNTPIQPLAPNESPPLPPNKPRPPPPRPMPPRPSLVKPQPHSASPNLSLQSTPIANSNRRPKEEGSPRTNIPKGTSGGANPGRPPPPRPTRPPPPKR